MTDLRLANLFVHDGRTTLVSDDDASNDEKDEANVYENANITDHTAIVVKKRKVDTK